ncbi:diguanylate cyclase domain-containing protein [Pelobacter propionicus]|uniref:Diguanylate cyclase n=1 Tax=Pelobacter propionicus (strain DSM 2379 / NBRC 103807 / OttBd1) TaxID=338966 RepID=A1AUE1_PELPD|nr:diguanylate cyclase [Pelobacter propionicus]ABL00962.1 diguanylate cyclase [Pelobacter propionicus DSM 2379]
MGTHDKSQAISLKRRINSVVSARWFAIAGALLVFVLTVSLGEAVLQAQRHEADNQRRIEMTSYAAMLRAHVERELNSLLYLNSGLGSYLVVRNNRIQSKEIGDMLAVLYKGNPHVRNFGIAVGYRLTYVYPLTGNEKAIGIDYRSLPGQWPVIQRIVASGKPALAGPLDLVQGGSGLIYRVPLFLGGNYWGLLSTVIDSDSLFKSVFKESKDGRFEHALRGRDGLGSKGDVILGNIALFARSDAVVQEIDIPGGRWAIAVAPRYDNFNHNLPYLARITVALAGGLIAWMLYALIRSRAELARLVMFDSLTGLPNRRLLTDRARVAFARQHRHPDQACAILFLDMNGFKDVNDRYGHNAGDAVLREVARRCRATVRAEDTVARWGGDEFVVLMEAVSEERVQALVARLREVLETQITLDGKRFQLGVSVGVVLHREGDASLEEIIGMADQRMYSDKLQRR